MTHQCAPACTRPAEPTDRQLSWQDVATIVVLIGFVTVCGILGAAMQGWA